jgi:hypothetical protein
MQEHTFTAPWQVPACGGGGDVDGVQPPPPKMLGALPIRGVDDVFNVFKMDVIEACLSEWGTHPEYSEIRRTLLEACGVGDDLFSRFEASLSPVERGNLLDVIDDLQLGHDFSDARDRFIDEVEVAMMSVLDDRAITAGNGGPPHRLGSAHNMNKFTKRSLELTCVLCGHAASLPVTEMLVTEERKKRIRPVIRFDRKPTPELNPDTLLTTVDLLDGIPDTTREQCRAYLSHRIGDFFTQPAQAIAMSSPMVRFEPEPGGGDGIKCGRLAARGAFSRQAAGEFLRARRSTIWSPRLLHPTEVRLSTSATCNSSARATATLDDMSTSAPRRAT